MLPYIFALSYAVLVFWCLVLSSAEKSHCYPKCSLSTYIMEDLVSMHLFVFKLQEKNTVGDSLSAVHFFLYLLCEKYRLAFLGGGSYP